MIRRAGATVYIDAAASSSDLRWWSHALRSVPGFRCGTTVRVSPCVPGLAGTVCECHDEDEHRFPSGSWRRTALWVGVGLVVAATVGLVLVATVGLIRALFTRGAPVAALTPPPAPQAPAALSPPQMLAPAPRPFLPPGAPRPVAVASPVQAQAQPPMLPVGGVVQRSNAGRTTPLLQVQRGGRKAATACCRRRGRR